MQMRFGDERDGLTEALGVEAIGKMTVAHSMNTSIFNFKIYTDDILLLRPAASARLSQPIAGSLGLQ
jgi:hypothetical protein